MFKCPPSPEKLFSVSSKSDSSFLDIPHQDILFCVISKTQHLFNLPHTLVDPFIPLFHYFLYSQLVYKTHKGTLSCFFYSSTFHFQGPEKPLRTIEWTHSGPCCAYGEPGVVQSTSKHPVSLIH